MSPVQHRIYNIDPDLNPAAVEAHIRGKRKILAAGSTIDHLSQEELTEEAAEAARLDREQPGYLTDIGQSFGLQQDYRIWDDLIFRTRDQRRKATQAGAPTSDEGAPAQGEPQSQRAGPQHSDRR